MRVPSASSPSPFPARLLLLAAVSTFTVYASAGGAPLVQEEGAEESAPQAPAPEPGEDAQPEPFEALAPIRERMGEGDLEEARALLRELVAGGIEFLVEDVSDETADAWLEELYEVCGELGLLESRLAVQEVVHARLTARLPADHRDLLRAKLNLATTCAALGDLEGALALEEHVHAAWERLLPADHPDLLRARGNLAVTRAELGDLEGALALEEHVHAAWERLLPADHPDLIATKLNLAVTRRELGDLEGALALEEHVHAAWEQLLPADHPHLLAAKQNLAVTRAELGDLEGALALEEHVHSARERLLPADHPDLLDAKLNLAATRRQLGDPEGAHALSEHVHSARERLLPADHPDLLDAKLNLAVTRARLGDLEGALALEEHVHSTRERLLPADHPDLLDAKLNLAATRARLGDVEGALALVEHLHSARERLLFADHPDLLAAKLNLAATRSLLGDVEGALALEEHVHSALERLLPADHPDLLAAKLNLAGTRAALGDVEGTLALEEHVHSARERLLSEDHPDLLTAKQNLAATRAEFGDLESALSLQEHVQAAWQQLLPADHPDLLTAELNLAVTRMALGDLEGALALTGDLARALPTSLQRAVTAAPREARATAGEALQRLAEARIWSESQQPSFEATSFEVLETARYVAGAPLHARIATLEGEEALLARGRLHESQAELDRLVAGGPEVPGEDPGSEATEDELEERTEEARRQWRAAVQAAALRRDQAQRELLGLLEGDPLLRIAADEVAASLPRGHVAVGITKLPRWRWDEEANERVHEGPHYLAHVLPSRGEPRAVDLGLAAELERRIRDWRSALGAPIDPDAVGRGEEAAPTERGVGALSAEPLSELRTGRALRAALVDPLLATAGELDPGATLHVCLDGALFTVPIDALPLDEGTEVPHAVEGDVPRLGDLHRIRHELSMARLLRPEPEPEGAASVLVVGGVDFGAELEEVDDARVLPAVAQRQAERAPGWGAWEPLPGTAGELRELAALSAELLGVEAELSSGESVTAAALAEAASGKRYVHLATHGWFLPETVKSMLDDEPVEGRDLLGGRETVTGFAPLALCGLVLSGANAAEDELERSARLLTAQELAGFDLSACDLAVLSACETNVGVGITRVGEGVQSLQTALHLAGARTSVTSLWSVEDQATRTLMRRFYEHLWRDGLGKAEALWAAKQSLRREGRPPSVWAGWVLAGDPD